MKYIRIRGAREHNLKSINLDIPKERFVIITGLSGSGKSSLAFNTIYAESQRLYIESLSTYARQFLGQMQKPDVDFIEGLSPSIAIEQRTITHNPRSTVGTVTEVYDYLRLLFARVGKAYCYRCGREITSQTPQQMVDKIMSYPPGTRILVLAPVVRGKKGEFRDLFRRLLKMGYVRVFVDGEMKDLESPIDLDKNKKHDIDVVVDRLVISSDIRGRLTDSVEQALELADGVLKIRNYDTGEEELFSSKFACVYCGISYPDIEPRLFSFNSPYGACPVCQGLGVTYTFDEEDIFPSPHLPIKSALASWVHIGRIFEMKLKDLFLYYGYDFHTPYRELPPEFRRKILYGTDDPIPITRGGAKYRGYWKYEGIVNYLLERYGESEGDEFMEISSHLKYRTCPACGGARLRKEALHVKIAGKNIYEVTQMTVKKALEFFKSLQFQGKDKIIAEKIIKEIVNRLSFMADVGLDYLTLDRTMGTLSGGEAQRIKLATQIGSRLTGVLYILDEPSIGLHPRDVDRLINSLKQLRDLGNTVIVVEHDESTIRSADFIVDLGPGAGEKGGEVVVAGTIDDVMKCERSLTGQYLSGKKRIPLPARRRKKAAGYIKIRGARTHNLKNIDVDIPLGMFVGITGVSGSGKSSLIVDLLYPALRKLTYYREEKFSSEEVDEISIKKGWVEKVINVDQSPIGRTPRSNPATYIGVFDSIRELFAMLPEARARGYTKSRFSFNVRGGRCEACKGEGVVRIEMHFLPDMYIVCDECKGKRYNRETLEVKLKGKSIADVLDMTVSEALEFFANFPKIKRKLQFLADVGLDYIKLGQPSTTFSGGEAQRIKLGRELLRRSTGRIVYILDEPTTGLHFDDVKKLIDVLQRLVDAGNTVIIIEHNLDVLKSVDYIIDLGPEGGEEGGMVVAEGTPEEIAMNDKSYTGKFLRKVLWTQNNEDREKENPTD